MAKLTVGQKFGVVPDEILNDAKLSLQAKGMFAYLQSKPDGWRFSAERIASQNKDGRSAIGNSLRELENAGMLKRSQKPGKNGLWGACDYELTVGRFPADGKTADGKTVDGKPTDISKTENSKTDISKTEYRLRRANGDAGEDEKDLKNIDSTCRGIDEKMTLDEFVAWCKSSKQAHVKIIGEWAETIKPSLETKPQWEAYIKRNLRTAKSLTVFSMAQMSEAFEKIEAIQKKTDFVPTMETLYKQLTK